MYENENNQISRHEFAEALALTTLACKRMQGASGPMWDVYFGAWRYWSDRTRIHLHYLGGLASVW